MLFRRLRIPGMPGSAQDPLPQTKETAMPVAPKRRISPDTWAVVVALVFAALIHFHLLKSVPW
jgi:hypothetical protein